MGYRQTDDELALEGARRNEADDYPEHKKMHAIPQDERQAIGQFFEWLMARYELAKWGSISYYSAEEHCEQCLAGGDHISCVGIDPTAFDVLIPTDAPRNPTDMLALYYGVDLKALDHEKRMMLAGLRLREHQRNVLSKKKLTKVPSSG